MERQRIFLVQILAKIWSEKETMIIYQRKGSGTDPSAIDNEENTKHELQRRVLAHRSSHYSGGGTPIRARPFHQNVLDTGARRISL
jgi:hypothetical protein